MLILIGIPTALAPFKWCQIFLVAAGRPQASTVWLSMPAAKLAGSLTWSRWQGLRAALVYGGGLAVSMLLAVMGGRAMFEGPSAGAS